MREHWALKPERIFLNHGSYGACPRKVLDYQTFLRDELEGSPVHFIHHVCPGMLQEVRLHLAQFLDAQPEHLAFVTNATSAVNSVLSSVSLSAGDQILTTNHVYNACSNALNLLSKRTGVEIVTARIPFPQVNNQQILSLLEEKITKKTRLALIDHVTSPTALILPVEEIAKLMASRGVPLLVDGAHAPGMLPLQLERLGRLGVTYYTGNFHKWCCSPKGAAFLWAHQKDQAHLHPTVISHGYNSLSQRSKFLEEFDWCGTFDPSAWLSVSPSLNFLESLYSGGWDELRSSCKNLLLEGRRVVAQSLPEQELVSPELLGQIASLQLPSTADHSLYSVLYNEYKIDSMITRWEGRPLIRLSAAPYNERWEYQKLADALSEIGRKSGWQTEKSGTER